MSEQDKETGKLGEKAVHRLLDLLKSKPEPPDGLTTSRDQAEMILDEVQSSWNEVKIMMSPFTTKEYRNKQDKNRSDQLKTLELSIRNVDAEIAAVRMILKRMR